LFRWKRQAVIDAGVVEGEPSVGADELVAARKRIAALEAESAYNHHRRHSALGYQSANGYAAARAHE